MLTDKDIKDIIGLMNMIACSFRGNMMTEEQFKTIEETWNGVRGCYLPCVIPKTRTVKEKFDESMENI